MYFLRVIIYLAKTHKPELFNVVAIHNLILGICICTKLRNYIWQ